MRRRSSRCVLAVAWVVAQALTVLAPGAIALGQAELARAGLASLRIAGPVRDGQASFRLVNRTPDALSYTSYDGGNVHNGLERLEPSGAWTDVGLGYCGLGADGAVVVSPGASHVLRAYVRPEPGTYRIRVRLERRAASGGISPVEIVSDPFPVR